MDDVLHAIPGLIALLPPTWRDLLISILAVIVSLAGVLAALKLWLKPDLNAPLWKQRLYRVVSVLDYVAANSTPIMKQLELKAKDVAIARKDEALRRSVPAMSINPGPMNSED